MRRLVVVKLGGSFAFSPHLRDWLAGLATCAGRVVVVPGGGPFADAVRDAQPRMGFDHGAAHHMALLAMSQYGCALASLVDGFAVVASRFAIEQAVLARQVPVWSPVPMALRSGDLPVGGDGRQRGGLAGASDPCKTTTAGQAGCPCGRSGAGR